MKQVKPFFLKVRVRIEKQFVNLRLFYFLLSEGKIKSKNRNKIV